MRSKTVAVLFALLLASSALTLYFVHYSPNGQPHGDDTIQEGPTCLGTPFPKAVHDLDKISTCTSQFREEERQNKKDRKRGKICREVCKLTKLGVLDKRGAPSKAGYNATLDLMLPSDAIRRVFSKPDLCFGTYAHLTFANDETIDCKNYKGFVKCVWTSIMSVCEENFDDKGEWD